MRVSGLLAPAVAEELGVVWKRYGITCSANLGLGIVPVHLWCMPAPNSYTGQDTLEIFVLGHPEITSALASWLESKGCVTAEAGEFTRLAVESGKLDLSRAEAVMALVTAHDDASRRQALSDLSGQSAEVLTDLTRQLRQVSARYEMLFDFSEEEHAETEEASLSNDLKGFISKLDMHVGTDSAARSHSPSVALYGPPNAGKSSLFNALLGKPRSLVTDIAGTTRDAVRETIQIGQHKATLLDLSGIGKSDADFGSFAEDSTQRALEADVLLLLAEPSSEAESTSLLAELESADAAVRGRAIWVYTKTDSQKAPSQNPEKLEQVGVSATSGAGLAALQEILCQRLNDAAIGGSVSLQRQKAGEARRVLEVVDAESLPPEAVAREVRHALTLLDEALLNDNPGDVLDLIFSRFCIGK
ncbi:MAG: 50S ribosome-binding GTPase [Planctomycetes bacterium]|nr:50S ribosome-binding GTPase [Planctomycetota bacterium]